MPITIATSGVRLLFRHWNVSAQRMLREG